MQRPVDSWSLHGVNPCSDIVGSALTPLTPLTPLTALTPLTPGRCTRSLQFQMGSERETESCRRERDVSTCLSGMLCLMPQLAELLLLLLLLSAPLLPRCRAQGTGVDIHQEVKLAQGAGCCCHVRKLYNMGGGLRRCACMIEALLICQTRDAGCHEFCKIPAVVSREQTITRDANKSERGGYECRRAAEW